MEKKEKVIFRNKAKLAIRDIAFYIELHGYPDNAEKFAEKLVQFGQSLSLFPNKYPICKQPQFARRSMRCAVFHKNFIFVYKLVKSETSAPLNTSLIIYNIVHCNTSTVFQSV